MFKFKEGARVRLKQPMVELGLSTEMTGVVWALYPTDPSSYEVKFTTNEGESFDVTLDQTELISATHPVEKKRSVPKPSEKVAAHV